MTFFELQKGSRKANNAQKEERHRARKQSSAAKREKQRKAAKVPKLPPRERECVACGQKVSRRKTASKHKCPNSKAGEAAVRQASQARPSAKTSQLP